jgi:hypothetical protein
MKRSRSTSGDLADGEANKRQRFEAKGDGTDAMSDDQGMSKVRALHCLFSSQFGRH